METDKSFEVETFEYKQESKSNLNSLDLFTPKVKKSEVLLVYIHGGLWRSGDKSEARHIGEHWCSLGFSTACVNYRISSDLPTNHVKHPDHTSDCSNAIEWLFNHKDQYNFAKAVLIGHSCGAHIAALLVLQSKTFNMHRDILNWISACVGIEGLYDLPLFSRDFPEWAPSMHCSWGTDEMKWISPSHLTPENQELSLCPWLVLHSPADKYVNVAQPEGFKEHLTVLKVDVKIGLHIQGDHFEPVKNIGTQNDDVTPSILKFLSNSKIDKVC